MNWKVNLKYIIFNYCIIQLNRGWALNDQLFDQFIILRHCFCKVKTSFGKHRITWCLVTVSNLCSGFLYSFVSGLYE